jgi:hypothetical protein
MTFPKYLLVKTDVEGNLYAGEHPTELPNDEIEVSDRTARYKLVGTGEIHYAAPVYVEDAQS